MRSRDEYGWREASSARFLFVRHLVCVLARHANTADVFAAALMVSDLVLMKLPTP